MLLSQPIIRLVHRARPLNTDPRRGNIGAIPDRKIERVQAIGRHPDFRIGLLQGLRPDIVVPDAVKLAIKIKPPLTRKRFQDQGKTFPEPCLRFRWVDIVGQVFGRKTTQRSPNETPIAQVIQHGDLFRNGQRVV